MPLNCVSRKTRTNKTFHTFMTLLRVKAIVMVLNPTFNNISAIKWRSVLLVKETGVPGEKHPSVAS